MRESPDRLTERVLQMLAAARGSPMSRDEVRERLTLRLRRNLSYLARKQQHTPYVEALEGGLEAMEGFWAECLLVCDTVALSWYLAIVKQARETPKQ